MAFKNISLLEAVRKGQIHVVRSLLSKGIDVNQRDGDGNTPLIIAVCHHQTKIVRVLIQHQADVHARNKKGQTAWSWATLTSNSEVIELLLHQGVDINTKVEHAGWQGLTALIIVVHGGDEHLVRFLIEHGADMEIPSPQGWSALTLAIVEDRFNTVTYLVDQGVNINRKVEEGSWKGYTPLMLAVDKGYTHIVRFLTEHGADVNARNDKGISSLMWAVIQGYLDIVEILVDHGADINAKDQEDQTALTYARQYRQGEILNMLIEKGANDTFHRRSRCLQIGQTSLLLLRLAVESVKHKIEGSPTPSLSQKSRLKQTSSSETVNLRWSCEIPEATCITHGNWEGDGNSKILVADAKKQLHILDIEGNTLRTQPLPTRFSHIECGWHRVHGARLLGLSTKSSKVCVIDRYGKTSFWRYPKWIAIGGINGARWGDLNGDGNDEMALGMLINWRGRLVVLTDEMEPLWEISNIAAWQQVIIPQSSSQQALVLASDVGTIKVYNRIGKLLRTLQPLGLYLHSIAASTVDSSGRIQIAAIGSREETYKVLAFDLAGHVAWRTPTYEQLHSWVKGDFACGDMNGDGVREWAFMENPGELVFVSPQGEKLTTLSVPEALEQFLIVPQSEGYGILVTLQAGVIKAYQLDKS